MPGLQLHFALALRLDYSFDNEFRDEILNRIQSQDHNIRDPNNIPTLETVQTHLAHTSVKAILVHVDLIDLAEDLEWTTNYFATAIV